MMRLVVQEFMSLDGVVQAPNYPDEDPSAGFRRGGWVIPFMDEDALRWTIESVQGADAYLLGRGTFEMFAKHWPHASPAEAPPPLAEPLNSRPKWVASRTLRPPLGWSHVQLLSGDVVQAVRERTHHGRGTLLCIGSPGLAKTLLGADLVDELRLMIAPVLLGSGKRAFPETSGLQHWEITSARTTKAGAILATYARAPDLGR